MPYRGGPQLRDNAIVPEVKEEPEPEPKKKSWGKDAEKCKCGHRESDHVSHVVDRMRGCIGRQRRNQEKYCYCEHYPEGWNRKRTEAFLDKWEFNNYIEVLEEEPEPQGKIDTRGYNSEAL